MSLSARQHTRRGVIATDGTAHNHARCTSELFAPFRQLVRAGGPHPSQYVDLDRWVWRVAAHLSCGHITRQEVDAELMALGAKYLWGTLLGFSFIQPHGYPGDFEIIDRIYQKYVSPDPQCKRWDVCLQQHAAPRAVRNRKEYFKSLVRSHVQWSRSAVRILVLGSGPCRDVAESLDEHYPGTVRVTCVDQDSDAIRYGRAMCIRHAPHVQFKRANVVRDQIAGKFDLVWCAGVADYLSDPLFIRLLRSSLRAVVSGGEVAVGNFAPTSPSRDHMDVLGRWHLTYRTKDELLALSRRAQIKDVRATVDTEPLGVNLFLRVRRS